MKIIDSTLRPQFTSTFDVERVRAEFPILKLQVDGKPLVYLDNAASSQMPQPVIDRLVRYQTSQHANINRGVHYLSETATAEYEESRRKLQRFINAREDREVVFTSGTTDSINLVMHGYGRKFIGSGDEIILTTLEHHSNIVPWQMLAEEKGATIRVVPINDAGELLVDEYESLFTDRTKFVGMLHVSNALGTINPVKQMITFAHARGVPVLVDGAQAAPHMIVDVQDLDCDFYAFSGHKMCGPTGIGILYGKAELLECGQRLGLLRIARQQYHAPAGGVKARTRCKTWRRRHGGDRSTGWCGRQRECENCQGSRAAAGVPVLNVECWS